MAKNRQPIAKRCKALGISPAAMGYYKKETTRNANNMIAKVTAVPAREDIDLPIEEHLIVELYSK